MYHIITRKLKGIITDEESDRLKAWISRSSENQKIFDDVERVWNITGRLEMTEKVNIEDEWNRFRKNRETESVPLPISRSIGFTFYRMVAVLIPLVMISAFILIYNAQSAKSVWITVDAGNEVKNIVLPDGSKVWINQNSEISYLKNFSKDRTVKINGEGFFKVIRNGNKFVVDAGKTQVEVLGTEFSVNNFKGDSLTKVVVTEGKVLFGMKSDKTKEVKLLAGEKATFHAENHTLVKSVNESENSMAWIHQKLVFVNTNLSQVAKDLENYFNVPVMVNDSLEACLFSGTFVKPVLENVLDVISLSTGSTIKTHNNGYILEGNSCKK